MLDYDPEADEEEADGGETDGGGDRFHRYRPDLGRGSGFHAV